jgi:hypothetical protein
MNVRLPKLAISQCKNTPVALATPSALFVAKIFVRASKICLILPWRRVRPSVRKVITSRMDERVLITFRIENFNPTFSVTYDLVQLTNSTVWYLTWRHTHDFVEHCVCKYAQYRIVAAVVMWQLYTKALSVRFLTKMYINLLKPSGNFTYDQV